MRSAIGGAAAPLGRSVRFASAELVVALPTSTCSGIISLRSSQLQLLTSPPDPLTRYQYLVDQGVLRADAHQKTIINQIMRLWDDLVDYDPGALPEEEPEQSFVSHIPLNTSTLAPR